MFAPVSISSVTEYGDYLSNITKLQSSLFLYVVDVFDFHSLLFNSTLLSYFRNKEVIIVINKIDLLPIDTSLKRIQIWVYSQLKALTRMHEITVLDVIMVSARRSINIDQVVAKVKDVKEGRDLYVIGEPNVGKSSLINSFLRSWWNVDSVSGKRTGEAVADAFAGSSAVQTSESKRTQMQSLPSRGPNGRKFDITFYDESGVKDELDVEEGQRRDARPESFLVDAVPKGISMTKPLSDSDISLLREMRLKEKDALKTMGHDNEHTTTIDVLSMLAERKKRHRNKKDADQSLQVRKKSDVVSWSSDSDVDLNGASELTDPGTNERSRSSASGKSKQVAYSKESPPIPFTVSPLPGTTLGVLGAPLDPHGDSFCFDTPGIVIDPKKQALLESLAACAPFTSSPTQAVDVAQSDDGTGLSKRSLLQNIVPQKRFSFPLVRLIPSRCFFLGGLIRIEYEHLEEGDQQHQAGGIIATVASQLPVHVSSNRNADALWKRHVLSVETDPRRLAEAETSEIAEVVPTKRLLQPALSPLLFASEFDLKDHIPEYMAESLSAFEAQGAQRSLRRSDDSFGSSPSETLNRRREKRRTSLVDIVFPGLGWVSLSPVEIQGMFGWSRTVNGARIRVFCCDGITPHLREPMLPYEATGTSTSDWIQ
jgi:hypothetical protein